MLDDVFVDSKKDKLETLEWHRMIYSPEHYIKLTFKHDKEGFGCDVKALRIEEGMTRAEVRAELLRVASLLYCEE